MSLYPPVVEEIGAHGDAEGCNRDYLIKAGSVVHVGGCPVRLESDTFVSTATNLTAFMAPGVPATGDPGRPILSDADASADLSGAPRPDNPTL